MLSERQNESLRKIKNRQLNLYVAVNSSNANRDGGNFDTIQEMTAAAANNEIKKKYNNNNNNSCVILDEGKEEDKE